MGNIYFEGCQLCYLPMQRTVISQRQITPGGDIAEFLGTTSCTEFHVTPSKKYKYRDIVAYITKHHMLDQIATVEEVNEELNRMAEDQELPFWLPPLFDANNEDFEEEGELWFGYAVEPIVLSGHNTTNIRFHSIVRKGEKYELEKKPFRSTKLGENNPLLLWRKK